ncbi:MAG: hypothetical protein DME60_12855 [Verrucomicrobia bacterium]|nr:MAG: hypothetical protein DME60_12855 [Verrucomicrobiota bacterium]
MQYEINKPIFVVGSPRSGTSVLTWCLGKHPNIIPLEESNWMGRLAIDLARYYQIGSARGEYSLLSSMGLEKAEFFAVFGSTINDLILRHRVDLEKKRWRRAAGPTLPIDLFVSRYYARTRWVDGTPEYSFHICGLRKLFPNALFIHIVRDVSSVVRSMLLFQRVSGRRLAANEQEAYNYWLRTVSSCLLAERAYGPRVVLRLRHSDLVNEPEAAFRSLLNFLGEPYTPECLEPLAQRINSSNVPADFDGSDPQTDPAVVEKARQLSTELEKDSKFVEPSAVATDEIETAFDQRARDVSQLKEEGKVKDLLVLRLQKEFDERTAWALALKEEVKVKDLVILGLQKKLRRRPVDILKRILTGKSRR